MMTDSPHRMRSVVVTLALVGSALAASPAAAYQATDPEVVAIVGKAATYLSNSNPSGMGEKSLVGLALLKAGRSSGDAKVQGAIAAVREYLGGKGQLNGPVNYNLAIALNFMVEAGNSEYQAEIQDLLNRLLSRQESHGGWSYWPGEGNHGRNEGDSSMTQLATLGVWSAQRAGFNVPQEAAERLTNFWIRTQTPEGSWGYQGHLAPAGQRISQANVRPSLAIAGLASAYVCGHLFGLGSRGEQQEKEPALSAALQKVEQKKEGSRNYTPQNVSLDALRQTHALGDRYAQATYKGYENVPWTVYYMYGMERYQSFRELYLGQPVDNKWYDDGVAFLQKRQTAEGNFQGLQGHIETSFAVMFLTRSTKKAIERSFGNGLVRGGRGLPTDISMVTVDEKTGDVINPEVAGTVAQLMAILEDPKNANIDAIASNPDQLVEGLLRPAEDADKVAAAQRLQRLRDMVSRGAYQQRLVAVKALGRTGDLDNAPLLLYALTDPDPRVVRSAEEGLRFISRKFNGFGLPDDLQSDEMQKVRLQWRQWYLSLRPDGELLD